MVEILGDFVFIYTVESPKIIQSCQSTMINTFLASKPLYLLCLKFIFSTDLDHLSLSKSVNLATDVLKIKPPVFFIFPGNINMDENVKLGINLGSSIQAH